MALTAEQQAELERLQAEAVKPEPRTDTGVAGVLHTVLDVLSGTVAHVGADVWSALHSTVEQELGDAPAEEAAPVDKPADDGPSSNSGSSSSKGSKAAK